MAEYQLTASATYRGLEQTFVEYRTAETEPSSKPKARCRYNNEFSVCKDFLFGEVTDVMLRECTLPVFTLFIIGNENSLYFVSKNHKGIVKT